MAWSRRKNMKRTLYSSRIFYPQFFSGQIECFFSNSANENFVKRLITVAQTHKTFLETRLLKTKSFHQKILWTRRLEILQQCWLSFQKSNFFRSKSENKYKEDYVSRKIMYSFKMFLRTRKMQFLQPCWNSFRKSFFSAQNTKNLQWISSQSMFFFLTKLFWTGTIKFSQTFWVFSKVQFLRKIRDQWIEG